MGPGPSWTCTDPVGSAADLHQLVPATPSRREVWHLTVTRPALVLGSTQSAGDVDQDAADRLGIEVARRRSGGGAVLLLADEALWVDVIIPRGDPRWDDDVNRSFQWLGHVWRDVVDQVGGAPVGTGRVGVEGEPGVVAVHDGGLIRGASGAAVCFAGLGPGEVTVDGVKLVGLAQRRTRDFARFQCTVHLRWRPEVYRALLAPALGAMPPDQHELGGLPPVATLAAGRDVILGTLLEALTTT